MNRGDVRKAGRTSFLVSRSNGGNSPCIVEFHPAANQEITIYVPYILITLHTYVPYVLIYLKAGTKTIRLCTKARPCK